MRLARSGWRRCTNHWQTKRSTCEERLGLAMVVLAEFIVRSEEYGKEGGG